MFNFLLFELVSLSPLSLYIYVYVGLGVFDVIVGTACVCLLTSNLVEFFIFSWVLSTGCQVPLRLPASLWLGA